MLYTITVTVTITIMTTIVLLWRTDKQIHLKSFRTRPAQDIVQETDSAPQDRTRLFPKICLVQRLVGTRRCISQKNLVGTRSPHKT